MVACRPPLQRRNSEIPDAASQPLRAPTPVPGSFARGPANHARVAQPEVRHSFSSHDRGVPDGDSRSSWLIAARRAARRVQPRKQQCRSRRAARGGGPGWSRRLRRLPRHQVRTLPILPPHGTGSSTRQLRAGAFSFGTLHRRQVGPLQFRFLRSSVKREPLRCCCQVVRATNHATRRELQTAVCLPAHG